MVSLVCKIRLGTSEAGLRYLMQSMKFPYPEVPLYNDHSVKISLSTGGEALRGFRSFSLSWQRLDVHQAYVIRKLAEDALDSGDGLIYATVNRGWNGLGPAQDWIDVKGYPNIPSAPSVPNTRGFVSDTFTLIGQGLIIVNDPSTA